jgi:hypothetical protein
MPTVWAGNESVQVKNSVILKLVVGLRSQAMEESAGAIEGGNSSDLQ